ncbi:MAG: hypothetical protein PHX68_02195 [Alphaproteobacteria bacterium]|nr:hypothetical protein [Alphaproteobacteria bacterium]
MKKLLTAALCLAVVACQSHEFDPDIDRAQAARNTAKAEYVLEKGCPFAREDAAFRDCVYATYMSSSPRTFKAKELDDGQSIAVVSDAKRQAVNVKTTKTTTIETTEKITTPAGVTETVHEPIITQTTDEYTLRSGQDRAAVITQPKTIVVRETTFAEPVPPPPPPAAAEKPAPPQPALKKPEPPKPEPKKTWWDEYKEQNKPDAPDACDCNNPNEACPRCYNK